MKILVTGGGGFLGGAIVKALLARGHQVTCLQRGAYPWLEGAGVSVVTGDLGDRDCLDSAARDCDLVMHVAGKTGVWGPHADYYHSNVTGTKRVLETCRRHGITRLVYTSSPSVVFSGAHENRIDESAPYPRRYFNHYQATKAAAEQMVLAANCDRLATIALRPHLIWGPGDPHLVKRITDRARSGRLRLVNSDNLVDTTYIDNAVNAHLLAAAALFPGSVCAGNAYFISNGDPLPLPLLINRILEACDLPPVDHSISPMTAYAAGAALEFWHWLAGRDSEPVMTRFVARQLSCAHWYDIGAAARDFGYRPEISLAEGLRRLRLAAN